MEDHINTKIEIDDESEIFIRRAERQYNVMAVVFTLLSLSGLAIQLIRLKKYAFADYKEWYSVFSFSILPFVFIVYLCLSSLQMFYYYKAIKIQNRAIYSFDQDSFSKSFRYYVLGNTMSIISMTLYFFIDLILLYHESAVKA